MFTDVSHICGSPIDLAVSDPPDTRFTPFKTALAFDEPPFLFACGKKRQNCVNALLFSASDEHRGTHQRVTLWRDFCTPIEMKSTGKYIKDKSSPGKRTRQRTRRDRTNPTGTIPTDRDARWESLSQMLVLDLKEGTGSRHWASAVTVQGKTAFLLRSSRHRVTSLHQWATSGGPSRGGEVHCIVRLSARSDVDRAGKD